MRVNRDFNGSILIEWMNGRMNESLNEWTQYACRVQAREREWEWDRLQPVRGCSVRRSYLSSYQLRSLHTYISTLCVRVCVNWQLVGNWNGWAVCVCIGSLQAGRQQAPKRQSCNSGLGYCNENLFKLENANCIGAEGGLGGGSGSRSAPGVVLVLSGLRLATWNALKIMLPARFGHLFCFMAGACCLLSGAAEKGQLELL